MLEGRVRTKGRMNFVGESQGNAIHRRLRGHNSTSPVAYDRATASSEVN